MDSSEEYLRAKRRVRSLRGVYIHAVVFALVMTMLFAINAGTRGVWWVQWPFLGWGIGLSAHAVSVFGLAGWLGPEWEAKKIKELMAKKSGQ
jgi:hypothetical protein